MNGQTAGLTNGLSHLASVLPNGTDHIEVQGANIDPSVEEYEKELPFVYDGQVPLGDLISRVSREIYTELGILAETLPAMSDQVRRRKIADFVIAVKKQVVKLYALIKWARDADDVQKCMNITAFLTAQNHQFELAIAEFKWAKESLGPARLRNHDLLTALDVLTTGSYRRLPSFFESHYLPEKPLNNIQVRQVTLDLDDVIRFRIHSKEIVPVEMKEYRIRNGRITFTVPNLFETSLIITGAGADDGWGFVHIEFLFRIPEEESKGFTEFPRVPPAGFKEGISLAAHDVLAPRPAPEDVIDTPLIRVFNLLQMLSLTYQLEILLFQAMQMMTLGWKDYMAVEMARDRRSLTISYWVRKKPPPNQPPRPAHAPQAPPLLGGTFIIAITDCSGPAFRSPVERVRAELQAAARCRPGQRYSDQVESYRLTTKWEPTRPALGIPLDWAKDVFQEGLELDASQLDLEALVLKAIRRHSDAIMRVYYKTLTLMPAFRNVFAEDEVTLLEEDSALALRVNLCEDQNIIVNLDARTGKLVLRDTGDLAAAGRGPRFQTVSDKLNEQPWVVPEAMVRLRYSTIVESLDQKASYLGLNASRTKNLPREEIAKFGAHRGDLFIQLAGFPSHYLVVIVVDEGFKFALISVRPSTQSQPPCLLIDDFCWLDIGKLTGSSYDPLGPKSIILMGSKSKYSLETRFLRELHAYCCARVCHTKIEGQLKVRSIHYTHVLPTAPVSDAWTHVRSSLARSVPVLCVQSQALLAGAAAGEAAMPNIRIEPINWWSDRKCQVITSVKLKYAQRAAGGSTSIIRPSDRIMFDSTTSVVRFLSDNVDNCVQEFMDEWAKVSKVVIIAREVSTLSTSRKWKDVRLLSFDLETVRFTYFEDHTVAIRCKTEASGDNTYQVRFARADDATVPPSSLQADMAPFIHGLLKNDGALAASVHDVVGLLRDSLPVVLELDEILTGNEAGANDRGAPREDMDVDIFAKGAGWFRILYGDLRHALDIRLMKEKKVLILDGSHSVFGAFSRNDEATEVIGPLLPIPGLEKLVEEVVRAVGVGVVGSDVGLLCEAAAVRRGIRTMHNKVLAVLAGSGTQVKPSIQ